MEKNVEPICLIAPSETVMRQSEAIVRKYHRQVGIYQGSLEHAAELAGQLQEKGAEIFISRGGTRRCIEKVVHGRTVEINQVLADYVPVMEEAVGLNGLIAFFRYGEMPEYVRTMCLLLKLDARYYLFSNLEDCERAVMEAVKDGAVLGIGGADAAACAARHGLRYIEVGNSEQSLLQAIDTAEQMLELKREEYMKQQQLKVRLERYKMIFNYTHDAIIGVDEYGKVDVLNQEAEKLIQKASASCQGQELDAILPNIHINAILGNGKKELDQLMNIKGTMVSANKLPIVVDDEVMGAVTIFQDVKALQDKEKKIRLKLHEKGLVARYHFTDIVGDSPIMRHNIQLAEKFAKSDATVLIGGETGTGKELFAQSIHNESRRADGPFVAVNCGALPKNLLEAELFGYEEGAFTGARKGGKQGIFELAHGGTVFLDEIGEMPLETQVQLLRVLQEKEIRRIGSDRVIPVDIRVIAATHRDLQKNVREKRFREDLYYRLNVLNLDIPAIRERREDIGQLAESLYVGYAGKGRKEDLNFIEHLLERLHNYEWPGNVRELHNLVERVYVLLSQGEEYDFVERYICDSLQVSQEDEAEDLELWEKNHIIETLKQCRLDVSKAAEILGISRGTLYRKIKKYNIQL